MSNGATARDRKMATKEYGRRVDAKAHLLSEDPFLGKMSGEVKALIDSTVAELREVMMRTLSQTFSQSQSSRN
jgi:hypothetical protein